MLEESRYPQPYVVNSSYPKQPLHHMSMSGHDAIETKKFQLLAMLES